MPTYLYQHESNESSLFNTSESNNYMTKQLPPRVNRELPCQKQIYPFQRSH